MGAIALVAAEFAALPVARWKTRRSMLPPHAADTVPLFLLETLRSNDRCDASSAASLAPQASIDAATLPPRSAETSRWHASEERASDDAKRSPALSEFVRRWPPRPPHLPFQLIAASVCIHSDLFSWGTHQRWKAFALLRRTAAALRAQPHSIGVPEHVGEWFADALPRPHWLSLVCLAVAPYPDQCPLHVPRRATFTLAPLIDFCVSLRSCSRSSPPWLPTPC